MPFPGRHPRLTKANIAACAAGMRLGARVLPALPERAKRLLMGGRPVTIDGSTLDPTLQIFLAAQKLAGVSGLSEGKHPVIVRERMRKALLAMEHEPVAVGGVGALSIPGAAGPIPARHYWPEGGGASPLLVYYHGGGWVFGDLDMFDRPCRLICRGAGIHVLSVDYRLAPEHPAPAGLEDAYAAFRWALQHGGELGAEPGRIAVGGDSAGGNFAAVVSQRGRDEGTPPALQVLLYPITDMTARTRSRRLFGDGLLLTEDDMEWFNRQYIGGSELEPSDPRISPLLATDLSGLPRALVITGGFDPLRDEGEAYATAMRDAGVVVDLRRMDTLIHAFANFVPLGGGSAAGVADMISAIRADLCYR
jgi:acetyl esterase